VAAASDGLDGYIARKYNQRSELGVILDPIADKGLLLAAIITLTFSNWSYELPLWFTVLVIARDAIIVVGSLMLHFFLGKVNVRPSWVGKTATALQMLAISLVLLQLRIGAFERSFTLFGQQLEFEFLDFPVLLAGVFTLISGIGYVFDGIAQLHASGHGNAQK
jgi:CDP-diacylglycerol--glycerol-3-phosphate 3-phosphatidyltransferase